MPCSHNTEPGAWVALGPDPFLEMLVPLREEHRRRGDASLVAGNARNIERILREIGNRQVKLLVVEDPADPSVRPQYHSPFLQRVDGPDVLLGWIRMNHAALASYVWRMTALLRRGDAPTQPIVLLGPRERRYLDLIDELEKIATSTSELTTFRWTAERIRRAPMVDALRLGAAAVFYAGHGNVGGWLAYGGLGIEAFRGGGAWSNEHTNALMFSLSCSAGRASSPEASKDARLGLADGVTAHGAAGAVLAPVGDTLHENTRLLAGALVRALADGRRGLREILAAARSEGASLEGYVVIGDPALSAASAPGALHRGETVSAPAPDADPAPTIAGASRH
jgi:hypothetical protein